MVIDGDLDIAARETLAATLRDLEQYAPETLVVDVTAVPFADCSGLRELDRSRRRVEATGRRFRIRDADPALVRVARLAQYVELAETMTSGAPSRRNIAHVRARVGATSHSSKAESAQRRT
ncbi:hypothetical protein GCM10009798_14030 [Nocardioides panacihumi]|uniref:STAS domain-containing protein n=1 Tax=Nocardioides panacihumi TaxID=400774 RepID=A0ABP5C1G1_9ACTN